MESRSRPLAPARSPSGSFGLSADPSRAAAAPGRLAVGHPVAIVDIGSNSVRLVIYEGLTRAPTPTYNEKVLCGLGRHVASTGRLDDEAIAHALKALARFRALCRIAGVGEVCVLATAAAREASNGPAFLDAAADACGAPVALLTGAREAELSALGVIAGFHRPDGIVGDLGGGSLELVDVRDGAVGTGATLRLGGLALADLSAGSPRRARMLVREALAGSEPLRGLAGRTFYAVGGTWRALARLHQAAHDYPLRAMHGYVIDPREGADFLGVLERSEAQALEHVERVSEARRPLLAYGAVVLDEIVRAGHPREIAVSAHGVREGLLYDRLDAAARAEDPLLAAAGELNLLRSRSPRHGQDLQAWTDAFIDSAGFEESETERRLRHAACLLADIGWRAHPDYRGEQSLNIIAHAAFVGLDHPGRAYLALSVFFRHEGLKSDTASPRLRTLAGERLFERARLLAALMRVAYPISVAMADVLPRTRLVAHEGAAVLSLPPDLAALASEQLDNRLRQLSRVVGLEPRIDAAA